MPAYAPFDWYETPLFYDIIFDVDTERETNFLCDVWSRHVTSRGRRVLEPACGSGRLVASMAARGFGVTGIDLCKGSLDFARQRLKARGDKGRLLEANMADFAIAGPRGFDLAHCLVSSFKYLLSESEARSHLWSIAEALAPGGVYVLGVHLADYSDRHCTRERWLGSRDGVDVVCNIHGWPSDPVTRTEQVRSRLIVTEQGTVRRYESRWTFRTYDLGQMGALLSTEPRLEHIATYDFGHDIDHPVEFDGETVDNVLILRRRH